MLTERQQRVLAVLSTSPEGMAPPVLWKRLGEGLPEWEFKKWTPPFGCIPILQRPLNNPASFSRYQGLDSLEPLATFEGNPQIDDMLCPWRTPPRVPHLRTT